MSEQIVTFDGTIAPDGAKCKKIKGAYYIENEQCFRIEGKWYRVNSGLIGYSLDSKQWKLLTELSGQTQVLYAPGKVGFTQQFDEFSYIPYTSKKLGTGFATDESILLESGLVECKDGSGFGDSPKDSNGLKGYNFELSYSIKDKPSYLQFIKKASKFSRPAQNYDRALDALSNGLSYGIENESRTGYIAPYALGKYGIVPLRDGSISGVEYATLPMSGISGAILVDRVFDIWTTRLQYDLRCSVHIHVGNIDPNDHYFVLALYYLCWRIQSEIFEILPNYKRDAGYFQQVKKDYARPLRKLVDGTTITRDPKVIQSSFKVLWDWMTENQGIRVGDTKFKEGQPKWNYNSRYFWVNFLNLYFGGETVEFRCFPPTVSKKRFQNYLLICLGIVRFAQTYPDRVFSSTKVSLNDIVDAIRDNFGQGGSPHTMQMSRDLLTFMNNERAQYDKASWQNQESYDHYRQWDSKGS